MTQSTPSTMTVQLRYFASIREALGAAESLPIDGPLALWQLRDLLIQRSAAHAEVLNRARPVRAAVNQTMADEAVLVGDGDVVAFFPPVTGG